MADLMQIRRRILMQTGNLPPGYREYDYLQTDAWKSYIDTGVPGNDNTIQMDFVFEIINGVGWSPLIGSYDNNRNNLMWAVRQASSTNEFGVAMNDSSFATATAYAKLPVSIYGVKIGLHLEYKKAVFSIGGVDYPYDGRGASGTASSYDIFIGNFATPQSYGSTHRFYGHFRIWSNGVLIREYVPAVRLRDSKAGFYDLVNHNFCPSIGSAEFIAGND